MFADDEANHSVTGAIGALPRIPKIKQVTDRDGFVSPEPDKYATFQEWFDAEVNPVKVAERARAEGKPAQLAVYWFTPGYDDAIGQLRKVSEELGPPLPPARPVTPPCPSTPKGDSCDHDDDRGPDDDDDELDFVQSVTFSPNVTRTGLDFTLDCGDSPSSRKVSSINDAAPSQCFSLFLFWLCPACHLCFL